MEKLALISPDFDHEELYLEMILEWRNEKIVPGILKPRGRDYSNWVNFINESKRKSHPTLVPSDTYFLIADNRLIGAVNIRHFLNDDLLKIGGHIGYGIRPSERGKRYAKVMLELALEKCQQMGINKVLVTCDKDNIASSKTILSCGGILENELTSNGKEILRYWISR